ncbi:hypothetical protein PG999_006057 [Apiospora kogelbergensis]|uniref:Uncharacterized protein n=1 Tax=Apiospora kogelbergensis TaxID=1337665 RepID=A0AAW0QTG0_9PEZI
MSAPDAPPPGRKLPFKRTVKRKSNDASPRHKAKTSVEDDDAAADSEVQAQLLGESYSASSPKKPCRNVTDREQKRQCISLSDSDEDEPGSRPSTQRSPRKHFNAQPDRPLSKSREPMRKHTSSPTRSRPPQPLKAPANVITLESSDDEDYKPPQSRSKTKEIIRDNTIAEEASFPGRNRRTPTIQIRSPNRNPL